MILGGGPHCLVSALSVSHTRLLQGRFQRKRFCSCLTAAIAHQKTKSIKYALEVTFEDSDALVLLGPSGRRKQRNVNSQACTSFGALSEEMYSLPNNITGVFDDWNLTLVTDDQI